MVRMLRRIAGRLLLAGAIGVSFAHPSFAFDHRSVNSVQVTTSQMRLEAMKAEMALLADYVTFQLPLEVRVGEEGLELHGNVYDEETRTAALRIARQSCFLPVFDCTRLPGPRRTVRGEPRRGGSSLRRSALDAIRQELDDRVSGLEIEVSHDGRLTLYGRVDSVEDKVAASRALRDVPGCQSVTNEMTVRSVRDSGHTLTKVTRDGHHAVHGTLTNGAGEPDRKRNTRDYDDPPPRRSSYDEEPAPRRGSRNSYDEDDRPTRRPSRNDYDEDPPARRNSRDNNDSARRRESDDPEGPRNRDSYSPVNYAGNGLPASRDVYVKMRAPNQVSPSTYVPPAGYALVPGYSPTGYTGAMPQAPMQTLLVNVPYPGQSPAQQPALKPKVVTMRDRMANLFGLSSDKPEKPATSAPQAQLPLLVAAPAMTPAVHSLNARPAAQQQPAAPQQAVASNWPPAYRSETVGAPVVNGSPLGRSTAISLAARPEDAARAQAAAEKPQTPKPAIPQMAAPAQVMTVPAVVVAPMMQMPVQQPMQAPPAVIGQSQTATATASAKPPTPAAPLSLPPAPAAQQTANAKLPLPPAPPPPTANKPAETQSASAMPMKLPPVPTIPKQPPTAVVQTPAPTPQPTQQPVTQQPVVQSPAPGTLPIPPGATMSQPPFQPPVVSTKPVGPVDPHATPRVQLPIPPNAPNAPEQLSMPPITNPGEMPKLTAPPKPLPQAPVSTPGATPVVKQLSVNEAIDVQGINSAAITMPVGPPAKVEAPKGGVRVTHVLTADQLKPIVAKACGKLAKAVRVETTPDGKPVFHIDAVVSSEKEIIGQLLSVPEIAGSNVKIHINLPQ